MKYLLAIPFLALVLSSSAAEPATIDFTGHYELVKKSGTVFALDAQQKGKTATASFSAAHADGSGAAPDGDGQGEVNAKGELKFTWTDSFDNRGMATLRRSGKQYLLSMEPTKVSEPRALVFYGEITLKRTATKPQSPPR